MQKSLKAALVALVFTLSVTAFGAQPASAHPEVCAGQGVLETPAMYYFTVGPQVDGPWTFTLTVGACVPTLGTLYASGTITGNCNVATGSGLANGHAFTFQWVNGNWTWGGPQAYGEWQAVPDTTRGQSCVTGAKTWLVTGAAALV